jgi:hypothetical protein
VQLGSLVRVDIFDVVVALVLSVDWLFMMFGWSCATIFPSTNRHTNASFEPHSGHPSLLNTPHRQYGRTSHIWVLSGRFWWSTSPKNEERVQFCTIVKPYQKTHFFAKLFYKNQKTITFWRLPARSIYIDKRGDIALSTDMNKFNILHVVAVLHDCEVPPLKGTSTF